MFSPSSADGGLIKYLQYHMVKRRENIVVVGPAGCGKSCLIETLTVKYGVQYFGIADELREVSESVEFVVFDDFDFSDFSVDDMKRLLDREFDNQRVKVRYKDALLKRQMTRIILCKEVPKCLEDPAVQASNCSCCVSVYMCMYLCLYMCM
jgi:cytidylate kinase